MSADKLASFRVDSQLWEQFQSHAKENNTNASALLVAYIKSVVNTGNVITSNPVVNTSTEVNNPTLSTQDIDNCIDKKIKQSIQNINTMSLQDIDNRIIESLADGGIGDAISNSYKSIMGQFNGLVMEVEALKSRLEELTSIPPAAVPQSPITEELTTDNEQLLNNDGQITTELESDRSSTDFPSMTDEQIIELFGLESIVTGNSYDKDSLKDDGILDRFAQNQDVLSSLGIKYRENISPVNNLLKKLNFTVIKHPDKRTHHTSKE
jgi:hypothetical protein